MPPAPPGGGRRLAAPARAQANARADPHAAKLWIVRFLLTLWVPLVLACASIALTVLADRLRAAGVRPLLWRIGDAAAGVDGGAAAAVPPLPRGVASAFRLGQLHGVALGACRSTATPGDAAAAALTEAAELLRVPAIDAATLDRIAHWLTADAQMYGEVTLADRVAGFFSFANVLWLVATIGIAVSVAPCLKVLLSPLLRILTGVLEVLLTIFRRVIYPISDVALALGVLALQWQALCYGQGVSEIVGMQGVFVGLLAVFVALPLVMFSVAKRSRFPSTPSGAKRTAEVATWVALAMALPLAYDLQSSLLGFVAVAALFAVLGFGVTGYGLCIVIGFDDKNALYRSVAGAIVLDALFLSVRLTPKSVWAALASEAARRALLEPFALGVLSFGNVVFFLALLILANKWIGRDSYMQSQLVFVLFVGAAAYVGAVHHITPLFNTAVTFVGLYVFEKLVEVPNMWNGGRAWVLMFLTSIGVYRLSLFLYDHPAFVVGLFDAQAIL